MVWRNGKLQTWPIWSAKAGTNKRAVWFVSGAGYYAPPMLIYKMAGLCEDLKHGATPQFFVLHSTQKSSYVRNYTSLQTKHYCMSTCVFSHVMFAVHWLKQCRHSWFSNAMHGPITRLHKHLFWTVFWGRAIVNRGRHLKHMLVYAQYIPLLLLIMLNSSIRHKWILKISQIF